MNSTTLSSENCRGVRWEHNLSVAGFWWPGWPDPVKRLCFIWLEKCRLNEWMETPCWWAHSTMSGCALCLCLCHLLDSRRQTCPVPCKTVVLGNTRWHSHATEGSLCPVRFMDSAVPATKSRGTDTGQASFSAEWIGRQVLRNRSHYLPQGKICLRVEVLLRQCWAVAKTGSLFSAASHWVGWIQRKWKADAERFSLRGLSSLPFA